MAQVILLVTMDGKAQNHKIFDGSLNPLWFVVLWLYTHPPSGCSNGDVRLVGGAISEEGRVEFCNANTWGTVCDDSWDIVDASVVCRQLGFSPLGARAFNNAFFGEGTGPILLDDVNCIRTEIRLSDCPANPIGSHNCLHSEDAGVRCMSGMFCCCFLLCFFFGGGGGVRGVVQTRT